MAAAAKAKAAAAVKVPVKASSKELDVLRAGSKNTLDMVCRILANKLHFQLFDVAAWVLSAQQESFGRWLTMSRTQKCMLELHLLWAQEDDVAK